MRSHARPHLGNVTFRRRGSADAGSSPAPATRGNGRRRGGWHHPIGGGGTLARRVPRAEDVEMGAVWFVARSQGRRRWRAFAVLAVVAGVLGGLATSLIAGASRSASVVARYSAAQPAVDVRVFGSGLDLKQVRAIPDVARAEVTSYVAMNHVDRDG